MDKYEKDEVSLEPQNVATDANIGDISLAQTDQLERGLKSRHIQFLALGGACVTPFFPLCRGNSDAFGIATCLLLDTIAAID